MAVGSLGPQVCWGAASLRSEASLALVQRFPVAIKCAGAGGLIITPPQDARVPSPGPSRRRRMLVFPLRGVDGTLGPSPSPGSAFFSSGPGRPPCPGRAWEPGGRTGADHGPPSLALSLQLSGASLFVVSSGHPPNAMLGRGTAEVRFRSLESNFTDARDAVGAQGCARARLLLVFIARLFLFFLGFWVWFQTSVVPSRCFP